MKKRRDDKTQPTTKAKVKAVRNALEVLQIISPANPRCCKVLGSKARNIAPNAVANKTDIRYFSIALSGPEFLRNTTTRPLKPAIAIPISAIVVNVSRDSNLHLFRLSQLVAFSTQFANPVAKITIVVVDILVPPFCKNR